MLRIILQIIKNFLKSYRVQTRPDPVTPTVDVAPITQIEEIKELSWFATKSTQSLADAFAGTGPVIESNILSGNSAPKIYPEEKYADDITNVIGQIKPYELKTRDLPITNNSLRVGDLVRRDQLDQTDKPRVSNWNDEVEVLNYYPIINQYDTTENYTNYHKTDHHADNTPTAQEDSHSYHHADRDSTSHSSYEDYGHECDSSSEAD